MASSGAISMEIENPIKKNKASDNSNRKSIRRQSTIQHVKKHKHKYAACITAKVIIIVVVVIIALHNKMKLLQQLVYM